MFESRAGGRPILRFDVTEANQSLSYLVPAGVGDQVTSGQLGGGLEGGKHPIIRTATSGELYRVTPGLPPSPPGEIHNGYYQHDGLKM